MAGATPPQQFVWDQIRPVDANLRLSAKLLESLNLNGLQCGAGEHLQADWLNTDARRHFDIHGTTTQPNRLALLIGAKPFYYLEHDATRRFPIEGQAFEWVYSEHFIEHISLEQCVSWLREIRRLVKPGGLIRLSTPDIGIYVRAYADPRGAFFDNHQKRLRLLQVQGATQRPAWMMNQIFRHWGHQWLYDFEEVVFAAEAAGFLRRNVQRCAFREGRESNVAALDLSIRNDESLYVEIWA